MKKRDDVERGRDQEKKEGRTNGRRMMKQNKLQSKIAEEKQIVI